MAVPKRLAYDSARDYYVVLAVSPLAMPEDLQRAYRERAKTLHPDRNKAPDATAQFQLLNEAYEVLRDPDARYVYDSLRERQLEVKLNRLNGSTPKPDSTAIKTPKRAPSHSVWGGLLRGPYRVVFMALGIVFVANLTFIMLAPSPSSSSAPLVDNGTPAPNLNSDDPRPLPAQLDPERCPVTAFISAPVNGATVPGGFPVIGTADNAFVLDWTPATLNADGSIQPFTWSALTHGDQAVERGTLATPPDTAVLPVGRLRLRLTVGTERCEVTVIHS